MSSNRSTGVLAVVLWGCAPEPGAMDTASPKGTDSADPAQSVRELANEIFLKTRDRVTDPYGYGGSTSDGCYARQYVIGSEILSGGRLPSGCEVVSLFAEWVPPMQSGTSSWGYHTASAISCTFPDGTTLCLAIDGLGSAVQTCDEWFTRWTQDPKKGSTVKTTKTGVRYGPADKNGTYDKGEHDKAKKIIEHRKSLTSTSTPEVSSPDSLDLLSDTGVQP